MTALQTLTDLVHLDDPYRHAPDKLYALQVEAVRERFAQRRKQIRVLEHRANPAGLGELHSLNVRSLARYRDLEEGDEKLSCAGTIDAYVRGVVEA